MGDNEITVEGAKEENDAPHENAEASKVENDSEHDI